MCYFGICCSSLKQKHHDIWKVTIIRSLLLKWCDFVTLSLLSRTYIKFGSCGWWSSVSTGHMFIMLSTGVASIAIWHSVNTVLLTVQLILVHMTLSLCAGQWRTLWANSLSIQQQVLVFNWIRWDFDCHIFCIICIFHIFSTFHKVVLCV